MATPENSGGSNGGSWLSAVGRLFGGSGSKQESNSSNDAVPTVVTHRTNDVQGSSNGVNTPVTQPVRSLRYLSPSAMDVRTSIDSSRIAPVKDIFAQSVTRKRRGDESAQDNLNSVELFSQSSVKRFRGLANHSLIEEPIRVSVSERLDATWAGGLSSFANPSASPASSVRSLKSRISDMGSTTSTGLSSKTRSILQQLERVSTPAKEARKLPVMRGVGTVSESWANLTSSLSVDPPLKRTMGSVPSRAQLLSSSLGAHQRKPYWRDIVRKPQHASTDTVEPPLDRMDQANGSVLHPLFDMGDSPVKTTPTPTTNGEVRKHQPVLKGCDGRNNNRPKNVFNANVLDDDSFAPLLPSVSLPLPVSSLPNKGFLDDVIFKFAVPKERMPGQAQKQAVVAAIESESDSDSDDNSDPESSSSEDNTSTDEHDSGNTKDKEVSRPPTSTDSETTATPSSSKNVSPLNQQKEKGASWECPGCFVSNTGSECPCCGHKKDAPAGSQKTLVSNISTFASKPTGAFSFGVSGGSGSAASTASTVAQPAISFGSGAASNPAGNSKDIVSIVTSVPSAISSADTQNDKPPTIARPDWSCPDCMVDNKGSSDACVCCQYVKYKTEGSAPKNVFGDRAFKAAPAPSGVSFGFSKPAGAATPSFGLGNGVPASVPSFGNSNANSDVNTTVPENNGIVNKPLFGVSVTKTGIPSLTVTPASENAVKEVPISFGNGSVGPSPPAFGIQTESAKLSTPFGNAGATLSLGPSITPFGNTDPKPSFGVQSTNEKPLFGAVTGIGGATSLGGLSSSTTAAPKNMFAVSTITPAPPALNLFGAGSTVASSPFGAPKVTTPAIAPFGSSLPSSAVPALSFGGAATAAIPAPVTSGLFGQPVPAPPQVKAPIFGASTSRSDEGAPSTKKGFFTSSADPSKQVSSPFSFNAPTAASAVPGNMFGSSSSVPSFGANNSAPAFGGFNTVPAAPVISNSSSTNSLFTAAIEPSTGFNFGNAPAQVGGAFNFGSAPAASNTTGGAFMFGSSAAPATNNGSFAFNAGPAAPAFSVGDPSHAGGAFAFGASSGGPSRGGPDRKIALAARRRKPGGR